MSPRKDQRALIREAEALGFVVKVTNGDHLRWTAPNGAFFFTAATPSDNRNTRNVRAQIKRALNSQVVRRKPSSVAL